MPESDVRWHRPPRRFLLIGSTADVDAWSSSVAHGLTNHVLELPAADHGLYVPGLLAGSAAVLGHVATAIEGSLGHIVWRTPAQ
jgi:hypothetical protein